MRNPSKEQAESRKRHVGHPESQLFEGDDEEKRREYRPVIERYCRSKFTQLMPTKPYQLDQLCYYCARFLALLYSVLCSEDILHNVGNYTTDNVQTWERYLATFLPKEMRASHGKIDRVLENWKAFSNYIVYGPRFQSESFSIGVEKFREDFRLMKKHWDSRH